MGSRLRTRLVFVYGIGALIAFGFSQVLVDLALQDRFEQFAEQNRERRRSDFVRVIGSFISEGGVVHRRGLRMAMQRFGVSVAEITDNTGKRLARLELDGRPPLPDADRGNGPERGLSSGDRVANLRGGVDGGPGGRPPERFAGDPFASGPLRSFPPGLRSVFDPAFCLDMRPDPWRAPGERPGEAIRASESRFRARFYREPLIVDGQTNGHVAFVSFGEPRTLAVIEHIFMNEVRNMLVWASILGATLFCLISWFLARSIAKPVELAAAAAARIAGGALDVRLEVRGAREIEGLSGGFNEMAGALQKKEELRTRMTSDVAHELRTPVAVLKAHLEGIRDNVLAADPAEIGSLLDETVRLERIINDLRSIWELENSGQSLRMEALDARALLEAAADRFRTLGRERAIGIEIEPHRGNAMVAGDRVAVQRALDNLVQNAVKYGHDGGTIKLRIIDEPVWRALEIADDGPGIPEDDLANIFERFYRADVARARQTGGAGLGLAIAREAVNACGGSLTARNNTPAPGCTFTMRLARV